MYIIGINAYHGDSSACLLKDGELVAASEEERFRRIKHWAGFPVEAIRSCIEQANIGIEDVAHFAVNSDPKANLARKVGFTLLNRPDIKLVLERLRNAKKRSSIADELEAGFPGYKCTAAIHHVEHHECHMASSFLVSPHEESVVVSIDGFGDFASAAWGVGKGHEMSVEGKIYFPHSLGIFYQALTQFIGFPHYGDEYKVMGLAPYGEPVFVDALKDVVLLKENGEFSLNLDYFRHDKEKIAYEWENGSPSVGTLFTEKLNDLLNCERKGDEPLEQVHKDLARSVQVTYEMALFNLLNVLHSR